MSAAWLYCPHCEEYHDAAPCPSPEEIREQCFKFQDENPRPKVEDERLDRVVRLPGLGAGELL